MQKFHYLKYFKKSHFTTNATQQSFDKSYTFTDQSPQSYYQQKNVQTCPDKQHKPQIRKQDKLLDLVKKGKNTSNSCINLQQRSENGNQTKNIINSTLKTNEYQGQKILSHIGQQFQYRKTNALLSEKVKRLKRDKIVASAFRSSQFGKQSIRDSGQMRRPQSTSMHNPPSPRQSFFSQPIKPYDRNKTAPNKKFRTLKTTFGDLNSSCKNYNDIYTIGLQNQRMGWRIVNTKSMIKQYLSSTYFTYHMYNGNVSTKEKFKSLQHKDRQKINFKQMNDVFKVFFNESTISDFKNTHNKKLFLNLKQKDQVQQCILEQSQPKQNPSIQNSFDFKSKKLSKSLNQQKNQQNKQSTQGQNKIKSPQRTKPSFFKSTYKRVGQPLNKRSYVSKIKSSDRNKNIPKMNYNQTQTKLNQRSLSLQNDTQVYQLQVYGKGSTVIEIRNIQIHSNPSMKSQDLLMLELIDRNCSQRTFKDSKGICSTPMRYVQMKKGVKFAIDMKSGEFIPLKIWKYHGINVVQVGIIDLNLTIYRNRKDYFNFQKKLSNKDNTTLGIQQVQLFKQQQVSPVGHKQERQILAYFSKQKLRKNKKMQIQTIMSFNCLIYNKKFSKSRNTDVVTIQNQQEKFFQDSRFE